jgi:hypothetical protein
MSFVSLLKKLVMLAATQKDKRVAFNQEQKTIGSAESSLENIVVPFKNLTPRFFYIQ